MLLSSSQLDCRDIILKLGYTLELKSENIVFLTLSADNEKSRSAWVKASQKAELDKEPYNFRFKNGMQNEYLEANKIDAVPRYLLFNTNGEIISSQFSVPSRPYFKEELLSYLKRKVMSM